MKAIETIYNGYRFRSRSEVGDTGYSFCCPGDWTEQSFQKPSGVELDAFEKAKQARFEQGACG